MRIARAPLRITLGGGGSDLAPGGVCVTAAITLYAYVICNRHHAGGYIVKHQSEVEHVTTIGDIDHDQIRYCLELAGPDPGVELVSMCDVDGGTGLGASGAFSVATFAALGCPDPIALAVEADIGWQDQRACLGGVRVTDENSSELIDVDLSGLRLYDTGMRHDAFTVLHANPRPSQDTLVAQAKTAVDGIAAGDFSFLTEQWDTKLQAAPTPEHRVIDAMITSLAVPAKLVGAGNGGMILAWSPEPLQTDLAEIPFDIDHEGRPVARPVAVLCGGKGERLKMIGQKCLVRIEGRPFLHWKLDQLVRNGATSFHLLVAYRFDDVIDAIGDHWMGRPVRYHLDSGEGQWAAHDLAVDDGLPFVHWLTYGDSLLEVPLVHSKFPYVYVNDEHPTDAGVLFLWGKSRKFIPKQTAERAWHINTQEDLGATRAHLRRHRVTV